MLVKWRILFWISVAMYATSMILPISYHEQGSGFGSGAFDRILDRDSLPQPIDGYVFGFQCFLWTTWMFGLSILGSLRGEPMLFLFGTWTWIANVFLYYGWIYLFRRSGKSTFVLGIFAIGFGLAAGHYFLSLRREGFPLLAAYYVWIGSFVFITASGWMKWSDERNRHALSRRTSVASLSSRIP